MIAKSDWDAAAEAYMARERERLGGPATPEEVVALLEGRLSPTEAERVRALLVYSPALTSILTESPRAIRRPRRWLPVAAGLFIAVLSGLLVESRWELRQLQRMPHVHGTRHVLVPMRSRGPAKTFVHRLRPERASFVIAPVITGDQDYPRYEVEILDLRGTEPKPVWSGEVHRQTDDSVDVAVPRGFLSVGTYRIEVYGVAGKRELLESYTIRIID